ncbi:hypothetical protein LCGC14_1566190 [marine sediment metagenome]|uniref:Uncharacterized protein n=1 Tax=marine sediment metagenome TaxID=412755 RepID=A0A0F9L1Y2_9ZZZZ
MARNVPASKRGFGWDEANSRLGVYAAGVLVASFDGANTRLLFNDNDINLGDNDYIQWGDASGGDVSVRWNGSLLQFLPAVDDTGYISIGDGTTDMDLRVYLGGPAKYATFDVGNAYFQLDDVDLRLGDNDEIKFGDASGGDVTLKWDGGLLQMLPAVSDTGYFAIGNGTLDMDVRIYTSVGKYLDIDIGNDYLSLVNLSLYAPNLATSSAQAGIVYVNSNGYLIQSD